jgi:hypothetical protein
MPPAINKHNQNNKKYNKLVNLHHRQLKFYLGNPNGKTSIRWDFIIAKDMITRGSYALSNEIPMHSYSLALFCRWLWLMDDLLLMHGQAQWLLCP